jgi:NAD(P)-dependent dehydrogenase (short-subunit alcohol dehydrogenase family)
MSIPTLFATTFQQLIDDHDTVALAQILRHDQRTCSAGGRPSPLAVRLTGISQTLADGIASHLLQGGHAIKAPPSILRLQYNEVLGGIKAHAQRITQSEAGTHADFKTEPAFTSPELKTALKVLRLLVDTKGLQPNRPVSNAIAAIESLLDEPGEPSADYGQEGLHSTFPYYRACYICHTRISSITSYPGYPSLCSSCGSFNISSSELSLPFNLNLNNRSALVTGGRLNLGYHTALRLLRCGARVIVTSRYPRDTERRYRQQADFSDWQLRLRIVGADFRTSRDVFRLAVVVRRTLAEWDPDGVPRLDVLINNAAQTLTDSVAVESRAIAQETELRAISTPSSLLVDHDDGYTPRVRGGAGSLALEMSSQGSELLLTTSTTRSQTATPTFGILSQFSTRPHSSWTQTLPEIPYEDVISAHSVNTFVPLILIRELLPLMGTEISMDTPPSEPRLADPSRTPTSNSLDPAGYIINVSSREGIFDSLQSSAGTLRKTQHHVHTNMSKAALNMITETEAATCWHDRRVCMNSVDPGYMSAAPGFGRNVPLGWEDGAGRVLWPVAVGWGKQDGSRPRAVWGRFLKHYRPSRWGGEGL